MKNKILPIIIILVIILIMLLGGIAFAYFGTDLFKSDREMFLTYFISNGQILDFLEDSDVANYSKKQETTPYTGEGILKTNNSFYVNDLEDNEKNILNTSNISFTSSIDKTNKYEYRTMTLNYSSTENLKLNYIHMQDYYGVKIDNIVNKYIAVENNNLKEFATKMGLDANTVVSIPNKIDFSSWKTAEKLFSDEELSTLKTKYQTIILENLTDEMFSKSENADSKIYTLKLTEAQFENIINKILEQVENDEILMNKLKEIIIESLECTEQEATEYISNIKDEIKKKIEEEKSEVKEELTINLYVNNKKVNQTEIILSGNKITLTPTADGLSISYLKNGAAAAYVVNLQKSKSADIVEYKISVLDGEVSMLKLAITFNGLTTLDTVKESFEFESTEDGTTYGYTYINTNTFTSALSENEVKVDDMLFLNTASDITNITGLFAQIGERLVSVNNEQMANLGVSKNPMTYYLPALMPLETISSMKNVDTDLSSLNLPKDLVTGIVKSVYTIMNTMGGVNSNSANEEFNFEN